MKLRLRSTASKETFKIDVPSDCTLPQLKHLIADRIGIVASSSSASSTITVSLNRRDELIGSRDETLSSLGVASGDLLFYTTESSVFFRNFQTLATGSFQPVSPKASSDIGIIYCGSSEDFYDGNTFLETAVVEGSGVGDEEMAVVKENETLEIEESGVGMKEEGMEVDLSIELDAKRQSVPHFFKNVWKEGQEEMLSGNRLLAVAVQAVLVDSGFVRLNSETGAPVNEFHIPNVDSLTGMTLRLRYTLGELIESESILPEFVTVKMYKHGLDLLVYGALTGSKNGCYCLRLDEGQYGRNMELELQKSSARGDDCEVGVGLFLSERHDSAVFRFYKEVKDKLALPLLVDICDKAGLLQPPCLMRLPIELKLKIFELVSGADLAKLACQCKDLQYLTSENSLWKMKYREEFGNADGDMSTNWKQKFVMSWKRTRKIKNREESNRFDTLVRFHRPLRNHRRPPFGTPFIIGGDYDLYPFADAGPYVAPFGGLSSRQPSFPYPSFQPSRRFPPNRRL